MEAEVRTPKKRKKKKRSDSPFKTALIVLLSLLVLVGGVFAFLYLNCLLYTSRAHETRSNLV